MRFEKIAGVPPPVAGLGITTFAGAIAGAVTGAISGPIGMMVGVALGSAAGIVAGVVLEDDAAAQWLRDRGD